MMMTDKSKPKKYDKPVTLHPPSLEDVLRGAADTGPMDDQPQRRQRQSDEPTSPHPEELADPAERAKDAMRKAGERNRRGKRPGGAGIRGGGAKKGIGALRGRGAFFF